MAGQLPEVLTQGDAARFLPPHQQLLFTRAVGRGEETAGVRPEWARGLSVKKWTLSLGSQLVTHPPSMTRAEHPLSLLVASILCLNNCVAPRKPSPEPAASTTQKARKAEKSSLFQKA